MSKGRVLTKKKWRNGQRRKPKNTYRSFKYIPSLKGETYVGKIIIKIKKLLSTEI